MSAAEKLERFCFWRAEPPVAALSNALGARRIHPPNEGFRRRKFGFIASLQRGENEPAKMLALQWAAA